jgi:hypothetical protein
VVKGEDEKLWERPWRDLQLFHATTTVWRLKDLVYYVRETLHLWWKI